MKTTRPILSSSQYHIKTTRLLIRPIREDDLDSFHKMRSQPEVMQYTLLGVIDRDKSATATWLERFLPPNDVKTFNCAIEALSDPGIAIGVVGLTILVPPECGYMIRKEDWGKGYASEALAAWLKAYWQLPRETVEVAEELPCLDREPNSDGITQEILRADTEAPNPASRRVLEKCGFQWYASEEVEKSSGGQTELIRLDHLYLDRPRQ